MKENLFKEMVEATIEGDEERCVALAQQAIDQGADLSQAIQEGYSRGCSSSAKNSPPWSTICPRSCSLPAL